MIDVDELNDPNEGKLDYRRANGAPMVSNPEDPEKWLRYSRPSGYGKPLDDEEALVNWRIFKAMEGVARSSSLAAEVVACKADDKITKRSLRDKALDKGAANEAADMGTALHAMTVRIEDETDVDFDPGEPYATDLAAYKECLERYGLVSEMVEVPMVNDNYRAAGTADRIYRLSKDLDTPTGKIEAGTLVLADIKTGAKFDFSLPGYAVQMALYAQGVLYDLTSNRRLPTPPLHPEWTILVHLPVGKGECHLQWVSIELGNYGAWIAHEVKEWRRKWKNGEFDGVPIPEPLDPVEAVVEAFDAVVDLDESMVPVMVEYCRVRIEQIGRTEQAKEHLIRRWPAGVPTPKQGLSKPGDVVAVLDVLDKIEADFSLPFLPDPRESQGHRSTLDRSNERNLETKEAKETNE